MAVCFKLIWNFILAFLLLVCIVQVQPKRNSRRRKPKLNTEEKVVRFVEKVCECKDIKGLSLSVTRGERVILSKGFGYKDLETKKKVDGKTLFGIAGLSQAFTAMTLLTILQQRKIKLTTPLSEFINITFPSKQLTSYTTLEDLLSHRTGLIENNYLRLNPNFTRRTQHKFLKYFDIQQDFRTGFLYNNVMYGLASYIIEHLTNTTWENAVNTQLFKPLNMERSTFTTTTNDVSKMNIAYPYLDPHGKGFQRISLDFMKKWGELGGSGAILSNALDMTRWMRVLLNDGKIYSKRILDSKIIKEMYKVRNHPGSGKTFMRPELLITISDDLYGLGFRKGFYRGFPMLTHTGSTWGYKSMLTLFPVQKLGIFTAQIGSDDKYIKRRLLHSYIADLYLGERPWLTDITACSFPWKSKQKKKTKKTKKKKKMSIKKRSAFSPPILLYDFAGTYSNQLWGDIRIETIRDNLKLIYGYATFYLTSTSNPLFFRGVGMNEVWFMKINSVKFEINQKTKVVSVTIRSFARRKPPKFIRVGK